jgi:hypothetical protein
MLGAGGSLWTRVWILGTGNPRAMGRFRRRGGVALDAYKCQAGNDRLTPGTGPGGPAGVGSCYVRNATATKSGL